MVPQISRVAKASSANSPLTHRLAVPPLPLEREKINIVALSLGERGDRKAVGEGAFSIFSNSRQPCFFFVFINIMERRQ
jgi:hypothetical protein